MKRLALLICTLLVAGCTALGQPYTKPAPPPEGKALVHLIRTSTGDGILWSTVFSINDTKAVSLYDKGYSTVYLDPGTYTFSAGTGLNFDHLKLHMTIEAEREYFVEYKEVQTGYRRFRNVIRAVSPVAGKSLVEKFFYKKADTVYESYSPALLPTADRGGYSG